MRTSIDIPDTLFRRIKALAAIKGITLKEFITRAIERELDEKKEKTVKDRITGPLVPSDKPGSLTITAEDIARVMEREDMHVPS
jgi:hypothetical protein